MGSNLQNVNAPKPPAFLDPLYSLDNCYYYSVPRFYDITHPYNRWLVGRTKANDADSIRRKLEVTPEFLRGKYFQVLDSPSMYFDNVKAGGPMYHTKCVLYLTPLGISLYMKSREVMELLLTYKDSYDEPVVHANEIQFASHVQNPCEGDFHAFPLFLIMVRREFFCAAGPLQAAGWNPNAEIALPIRRRYERRAFYFRDWLDVGLHLLSCKSFYPLHLLAKCILSSDAYRHSELPLRLVKPGPRDPPVRPVGLIDFNDLPAGVHLMGTETLLDIAQRYDYYRQSQSTAMAVQQLKREAASVGLNVERLEQMAGDTLEPIEDDEGNNRNNNARIANSNVSAFQSKAAKRIAALKLKRYCSVPLRILLFCLEKDKTCKSLQQCIEVIRVYVRSNYFCNGKRLELEDPRARDQRNMINCLLNMARREQDKIEATHEQIKSGKRRFAHLEEHRALESRCAQYTSNIDKIVSCLTHVMLQAKEITTFLHTKKIPIYSSAIVDYQMLPRVSFILSTLRFGVVREFNGIRNAWKYLTKGMLKEVVKDTALMLHCKVGKVPGSNEITAYRKQLVMEQAKEKKERKKPK